jgi:phospholipid/cholesterol/gamma-HCH transport system ATP-binding protein
LKRGRDLIRVHKLYKNFGAKQVLKGLDLEIQDGETLVILGRSGTGKSVLLRHLIGLERPDSGEIFIGSTNLTQIKGSPFYHLIREMGMLFQASALFDSMTVGENTAFYLRQHLTLSEEEIQKRVSTTLAMVGLEGTENLMPSDLSGGMKKRAALARLIVYRPKILLYDEPTTGLDPITAMQINELIIQIQEELHATSVVVTHDLCSAFHVADRIAFSHDGKILYIATIGEFKKIDDPLVQTFLKNSIPNGIGFYE